MVLFSLFHFYLLIAAAVILDFFQLQLQVAFSNGAKKKKSRKKLNFVRESPARRRWCKAEEEENLCLVARARRKTRKSNGETTLLLFNELLDRCAK
jgi:hypothetical protein